MRLALTATAAVLLWAAGYLAACWLFPFAACRRCDGSGKKRSPSGRAWRRCKRCKGTGARLRIGRKITNRMRGTLDDAA